MYDVIHAIKGNTKRMDKLFSLSNVMERRVQAKKYVIAECCTQKVKLSNNEIIKAVCRVLETA